MSANAKCLKFQRWGGGLLGYFATVCAKIHIRVGSNNPVAPCPQAVVRGAFFVSSSSACWRQEFGTQWYPGGWCSRKHGNLRLYKFQSRGFRFADSGREGTPRLDYINQKGRDSVI